MVFKNLCVFVILDKSNLSIGRVKYASLSIPLLLSFKKCEKVPRLGRVGITMAFSGTNLL